MGLDQAYNSALAGIFLNHRASRRCGLSTSGKTSVPFTRYLGRNSRNFIVNSNCESVGGCVCDGLLTLCEIRQTVDYVHC